MIDFNLSPPAQLVCAGGRTSITTGSTTYNFTYDALGRMSAYTNDDIRYYYTPDGKLSSMVYGSGEFEYRYTYDELGRLIEESYYYEVTEEWEEDGETYYDWYEVIEPIRKYEYTADGKLYRVYDVLNDEYTHYSYDISGRLEHVIQYDGDRLNDFSVNYFYNPTEGKEHLISSQFYFFNYSAGNETVYGQMWYDYDYNDDDSLKKLEVSSGEKRADLTYTYDDFKRPSTVTLVGKSYENNSYVNSGFTGTTTYGYKTVNGVTTGEVSNYTVNIGSTTNSTTKNYTYTYDGRGNIKAVSLDGVLQYEYYYDDLGQLYYVDDYVNDLIICYYYDNAGNLYERYVEGINDDTLYYDEFTYASSPYGDRLVDYNGESITYDEYGRTSSYRGKNILYYGYSFQQISRFGNASFTYYEDDLRRTKTVGGVTHYYTYEGINLIREEWGNNTLVFLYDASGSPIGMQYRNSSYATGIWDTYYYEKNLQGDIIAVYNAAGTKLVTYTYDAWGRILSITNGNNQDVTNNASHIGNINPLRYRGYYYDDDLDLYYLATRYYDPETCRFITADSYVSTGQGILGYNRYAYCGNNPIARKDIKGAFWEFVIDVVSLLYGAADVMHNPDNCLSWLSFVADVVDLLPIVSYTGESIRATKGMTNAIDATDGFYDAGRRIDFYITPNGEAIPATRSEYEYNLSKLEIKNGKYVGEDSNGSIRIRTNEIHEDKPDFSGDYSPYHATPHFHIERKKNIFTGGWYETYTGGMEMFYE